jgi:cytochrome P450
MVNDLHYDPFSPEIFEDPYPVYRRLREEAPVHRDHDGRWWVLSRFEDVWTALRDHATYSSRSGPAPENPDDNGRKYSIISMDPPKHDRVRGILNRLFTPRRIDLMDPTLRAIVSTYLDPLEPGSTVDAMEAFAGPIPSDVIGSLLGVPQQDQARLRELWDRFLTRSPGVAAVPEDAIDASREITRYVGELIAARHDDPGDDLISTVLGATYLDEDGQETELTEHEVQMFCNLLSAAGSETTQKLISNSLAALNDHPDQWARLVENPSLIPSAVDEALRYDTPSHWVARTTTRDVELHGTTIPAGDWVLLLLGSANRDEREYPDPDRFVADRDPDRVVYFGFGRHICLGQWLARREAELVLEEIVRRFPAYEIGVRERILTATVRGYSKLGINLR